MILASYEFKGDPTALLAGYERLVALFADTTDLQVCVTSEDGIVVYDACPSQEVFEQFSTSRGFADAIASVGLPSPVIRALGTVHRARLRELVG